MGYIGKESSNDKVGSEGKEGSKDHSKDGSKDRVEFAIDKQTIQTENSISDVPAYSDLYSTQRPYSRGPSEIFSF